MAVQPIMLGLGCTVHVDPLSGLGLNLYSAKTFAPPDRLPEELEAVSPLLLPFISTTMPPSASKQKRLAEKAAKQAAKVNGTPDASTSTSTPAGSVYGGSSANTPMTSLSTATSQDDLTSMAKLQIATDRYVVSRHIWAIATSTSTPQSQECCWSARI